MTQEEKAKRYDEAIERAKKWYNAPNVDKISTFGNRVIEEIFPELKESEDERIRKGIIRNLEYLMDRAEGFVKDELKERIAWLEKQGEQKPINQCNMHEPTLDEARKWNEAYEKGYSLDYENGRNEQKSAWSEEDNINCKRLLYFLDGGHLMHDHNIELHIWLKSIKDRVQLQSKQEWGEEDEKMCNDTINFIETGWTDNGKSHLIPWLKSLKERYTWKPSDEQMNMLDEVKRNPHLSTAEYSGLIGLMEQLKKLRKE